MIYKFKSKAAGDLLMLEESGNQVMRLFGREPSATGIFECRDMPALMQRLEEALRLDEEAQAQARQEAAHEGRRSQSPGVSLRLRVWPLREMMRRSCAADAPITWGV